MTQIYRPWPYVLATLVLCFPMAVVLAMRGQMAVGIMAAVRSTGARHYAETLHGIGLKKKKIAAYGLAAHPLGDRGGLCVAQHGLYNLEKPGLQSFFCAV